MSLSRTQYDRIMRRYDERQMENIRRQRQHIDELNETIPEWRELASRIPASYAGRVRAMLFPETERVTPPIFADMEDLHQKKEALLLKHGYPVDYPEITYHCPLCKDTGFVGSEKCRCFKQMETQILYDRSGLTEVLETENFSTFCDSYYSDSPDDVENGVTPYQNIKHVLAICLNFIRQFETETVNLLFYGTPGVGKTFLTNCIAKELLNRGYSAVYLSATRLFDLCADHAFRPDELTDEDRTLYDSLLTCELLIIDDLGTEVTNSFTVSSLFYIVNERMLRQKSMIISTNLAPRHIFDLYRERVFSRITSHFRLLYLFGADIRLKKSLEETH